MNTGLSPNSLIISILIEYNVKGKNGVLGEGKGEGNRKRSVYLRAKGRERRGGGGGGGLFTCNSLLLILLLISLPLQEWWGRGPKKEGGGGGGGKKSCLGEKKKKKKGSAADWRPCLNSSVPTPFGATYERGRKKEGRREKKVLKEKGGEREVLSSCPSPSSYLYTQ